MLGDAGANALGAMLGAAARPAAAVRRGWPCSAGVAGLTAASEKVSFTKVIARTPALHWLDMLGRRPPAPPAAGPGRRLSLQRLSRQRLSCQGLGPAGAGPSAAEAAAVANAETGPIPVVDPARPTAVP